MGIAIDSITYILPARRERNNETKSSFSSCWNSSR